MPLARVRNGILEGLELADGVVAFLGVPYAAPPVGEARWRPPAPVADWQGTRDATKFGPAAAQEAVPQNSLFHGGETVFSEDCLYLNIWSPPAVVQTSCPVIIWLHFGAFGFCSGQHPVTDGAAFSRRGIVVVTLNYRLGRFGFLAHPALSQDAASGCSGNYGLMDQIAALRWVQDNIAAFGGDSDRVTIYGASSGAFSVSALMASSHARGLFHRAVGGSGGAFGAAAANTGIGDMLQTREAAEQAGLKAMAGTGAFSGTDLRGLTTEQVLVAGGAFDFANGAEGVFDTRYPILDGDILSETPFETFRAGRQACVPLIVGSVDREETAVPFMTSPTTWRESAARFGDEREAFLDLYDARDEQETIASSRQASAARLFRSQSRLWADLHSMRAPVYSYCFTEAAPVPASTYAEQAFGDDLGAFHSSDVPYFFGNLDARAWRWSDADRRLSAAMMDYLVNLAATGQPRAEGAAAWPVYTGERPDVLRLATPIGIERRTPSREHAFWERQYARPLEAAVVK